MVRTEPLSIRRYVIYGSHTPYPGVNSYTASVHVNFHCLDWPGALVRDFPATVTTNDRTPIKELHARRAKDDEDRAGNLKIKAGEGVTFTIILTALAQESDVRVDLDWAASGLLEPQPSYRDVAWKHDVIEFTVRSRKGKPGKVVLTARSVGKPQSVTVIIQK